jgi:protein-export membrane protein SecD
LSTIPDVVVRGDQRIVVSIPSRDDPRRILELVGETYQLTLRLVVDGRETFEYRGRRLALAVPAFSGDMLDEGAIRVETAAQGSLDVREMAPKVAFGFRPPHDAEFADFTGRHVGRELAILLDDEVQWVGTIESAIHGNGVLSGGYTFEEAADVAMMLKSGTLPLSLEVESLGAVGPSLGQEIRELGLKALLLAVALLAALIALAYLHRSAFLLAGLVSLFCLLLLIAGLAAALRLTLDMVGIAGIVLSVGMGMDAFILVFEALEAEPFPARSTAARRVYSFAGEGRTLFHANATTLLVIALLLFTERLKSFALFIFVGLFASVVTIFITRRLLERTYGRLPDLGPDLLGALRRWQPRAFRLRGLYYAALAALLAFAVLKGPTLELGADFKAGTQVTVAGEREEDLQAAIAAVESG